MFKDLFDQDSSVYKKVTAFLTIIIGPIIAITTLIIFIIQTYQPSIIIYYPPNNTKENSPDSLLKKPELIINSGTEDHNAIVITCTVKSRMEDVNDDRTPIPTFSKNYTSGREISFKLYDMDYGYNEREGFVFMYFLINDEEIIEKSSITTSIFSRKFYEDFTIIAVYTIESVDNPRLDNIYHPLNIIGKKLNGESMFVQGDIKKIKNNEPILSGKHGEWIYLSGLERLRNHTLIGFSINGIMVKNLSSNHQVIDGIPIKFIDGMFHMNVIKATAIIFYYE
jgi:hypothetical protein